ncbi:hypothetical protein [Clostridium sp. M14]|uniref:hypothetical protein n=1 Tax=Clostridium sp. M14 TaxID=2716311 RepID=UPI0013EED54D|nr:hypothetical protein [Clostridium sp. M14]MBZ9693229.1 hypothetical protein [Clostridium sp. M14]
MKKLYEFYWDCGRQGNVEGMFIAEEKEVQESIGEEIYFGEILGKHSEVYGIIEEGEIKEIKVSETTVREMEQVIGTTISGYNPLNYIRYECSRCGDTGGIEDCDWYIDTKGEKTCEYCVTKEELNSFAKL